MLWFFLGLAGVATITLAMLYRRWRGDNPRQAWHLKQEAQATARAAAALAQVAAAATTSLVPQGAALVARNVEASAEARRSLRWVGPAEPLQIQGLVIPRPLTYVADSRTGCGDEPAAIDPIWP